MTNTKTTKAGERTQQRTPGPWHATAHWVKDAYGMLVCDTESNVSLPAVECAANARLIAAAPLLLQKCKDIAQWCERNRMGVGFSMEPPWLEFMLEAIAKAEGK